MQPETTTPAAGHAAGGSAQVLTPQAIDEVLSDFRRWLLELPADGQQAAAPAGETIDLHTLLGQFIAVRHEVNLQTKAVRAQQEQNATTLDLLRSAVDALRDSQSQARAGEETVARIAQALDSIRQAQSAARQSEQQATDEKLRPLLKTLVDVHDALALALGEIENIQETLDPLLEGIPKSAVEVPEVAASVSVNEMQPLPAWARWLGMDKYVQQQIQSSPNGHAPALQKLKDELERQEAARRDAVERITDTLESVITGYTMSLERIERALNQHELETIPCEDEPFDPERMEVVEAAVDTGRQSGEVIDVIRPGYTWRGRVFRYAQVRVAK